MSEPTLSPELRGEERPLVALETSVLAQGLPEPRNREAADRMEEAVRAAGALPAWTWVDEGAVRVGATGDELDRLCAEAAAKVARRDLPMAVAGRGLGATTVSATLWIAARAGIEVAATGGIGGVHRGGGDVSADLAELARSPVTLVCAGPKSITDPEATLERLEELGVAVVGYGTERLPFFLVRETPIALEHRADSPPEAAEVARARRDLGLAAALLMCVPIPEASALDADEVASAVARCEERAAREAVTGKNVTPFLLRCLAAETGGRSLEANMALLEENARVAGAIAAAL
ncbi:MAG TPA: pseudouridine-5'-phosphate glycosidase [Actinomycetota bacterium]